MHAVGPDDPLAEAAARLVLDALVEATFPSGTLVLVTADHGMAPVDPARTVYVNELWPALVQYLETGADGKPLAPAGSCRDLFLHVRDGHVEDVCAGLGERLDGVADVVSVAQLVGRASSPTRRPVSTRGSRTSSCSHATVRRSTGTTPVASNSVSTVSTAALALRRWRSRSSPGSPDLASVRRGTERPTTLVSSP